MPNYAGTLARLRRIADDADVSVSAKYSDEAEKYIKPKQKHETDGLHEKILKQIQSEYNEGYTSFKSKISKNLTRLRLYNNQMRDESSIGDSSIFLNHQTIIASLYYDKLAVSAEPREPGDEEVAENFNLLAEFDYDEMWKAWNDYQWAWDTGFYGYGLKWIYEFDRKSKTPIQQVWDPSSFIRDPRAKSPNGDRTGAGAMRFGGVEVFMTRNEMDGNPEYFNLDRLKGYGSGNSNTLTYQADQERRRAQGITAATDSVDGVNEHFCILRWLTHLKIGDSIQKCIVETGNEREVVVRITPLKDAEGKPLSYWPLIKRDMFPMSNSWDGVSIPDLTEDKQRFRAMLSNAIGQSARADVEPMYLFDKNKVTPQTDFKFGFNKFIQINGPVGDNVVFPLRKAQPGSFSWDFLNYLDLSTQSALGTPEIKRGVQSKDQRTLGENQLMLSASETRYSLTARLWGISEKEEWKMYYDCYARNFKQGIDKKMLRLAGVMGPKWKKLTRESIVAASPLGLDIKIESKEISEAKKRAIYNQAGAFISAALAEPSADRLYALRFWGKQRLPRQEVERILPLSFDEEVAKEENEALDEGKASPVHSWDNHDVHMRVHAGGEDTPAMRAHLNAHRNAKILQRIMPSAFPQMPMGAPVNVQASKETAPVDMPMGGAPVSPGTEMMK